MNVIIDQVVQKCSSNQKGRRLVRRILDNMKNYENSDRIKSLELLSLKTILKNGMMAEDSEKVQVTLSLLFRGSLLPDEQKYKPLNLYNFLEYTYVPRTDYARHLRDYHLLYPKSRTDPVLMMAVIQQNLDRESQFSIRMCRDFLEICWTGNPIARFPNRKNVKYDPLMVPMFARLGFSMKMNHVLIEFRAQRNMHKKDFTYAINYLNRIRDTFKYATPPDDWKKAVKEENHTIYCRSDTFYIDIEGLIVQAAYNFVSQYCPLLPHKYYDFSLYN